MSTEPEPTREELSAMAYSDGELAGDARRDFEERLRSEPRLAREVADYRALALVAREMAPPEPMDFEWERLRGDALFSGARRFGWGLFVAGTFGMGGLLLFSVLRAPLPLLLKVPLLLFAAGGILLFLSSVHARLRTLPYDPYRRVQR